MYFYQEADGNYVLEVGEQALIMTRGEAEDLFVDIGRALQDEDVRTQESEDG